MLLFRAVLDAPSDTLQPTTRLDSTAQEEVAKLLALTPDSVALTKKTVRATEDSVTIPEQPDSMSRDSLALSLLPPDSLSVDSLLADSLAADSAGRKSTGITDPITYTAQDSMVYDANTGLA